MPYTSLITRSDADALIPEEASAEILQHAPEGSSFMRQARRLPDMATNVRRLPVMSSLPIAYFVGEAPQSPAPAASSYKQTTEAEWAKLLITAEEIACIVPIPESVLEDADYDIWNQLRPHIVEAIGAAVDGAVYYGTGAPATWPGGIVPQAVAAGNVVNVGSDLYADIMGGTELAPGLIMRVELDGYFPTGYVAAIPMRGRLRGLRDTNGQPIFKTDMQGATPYTLDGSPVWFPRNGVIDPVQSLLICGDWEKTVFAIRKDITYKVLTEAVIQNPADGSIVYNLAQQDMVALRVTFRMGWQVANPANRVNTAATRFPFAVLRPPPGP